MFFVQKLSELKYEIVLYLHFSHPMHERPDLGELLEAFKKKDIVIKEFEAAKLKLKKAKSLLQMAELNKMKRVLRRMKYCDQVNILNVIKLLLLKTSWATHALQMSPPTHPIPTTLL